MGLGSRVRFAVRVWGLGFLGVGLGFGGEFEDWWAPGLGSRR